MIHINDFKPWSKGRYARILFIYELGYKHRKLKVEDRGGRERYYEIQNNHNLDMTEILLFINIIQEMSMKEIRKYLLNHNSKLVRYGKRTRRKKNKDEMV